jgi:hypothetical protein
MLLVVRLGGVMVCSSTLWPAVAAVAVFGRHRIGPLVERLHDSYGRGLVVVVLQDLARAADAGAAGTGSGRTRAAHRATWPPS